MATPAYVSVDQTRMGGKVFGERARAHLTIQYGDGEEKVAVLEIGLRGMSEDALDTAEHKRALRELVPALGAWWEADDPVYTQPRASS